MSELDLSGLDSLHDAEEYFHFFALGFDQRVVSVNRLHILKKFGQLKAGIDANANKEGGFPDTVLFDAYKEALKIAYETFLTSTPKEEKLFKVFRDGENPFNVVFHTGNEKAGGA